jgi:hypothetical protein
MSDTGDVEMQEPGTPASNISRGPEEVEEMLRLTDDEGEGEERVTNSGDAGSTDQSVSGAGMSTGAGNTATQQQPATTTEQPREDVPAPPPAAQEGKKMTTLSLSEIKKAVMDISLNNGTGTGDVRTRARRGSDPGISV